MKVESRTALNIESSRNGADELAYFQARRFQTLYIMTNLHTATMRNFFFSTSLIKYAGITNIYARLVGKFVPAHKIPTARISLVSHARTSSAKRITPYF